MVRQPGQEALAEPAPPAGPESNLELSLGVGSPAAVSGPSASLTGRVVAERYRVLERLGEGGMGSVYRAEHLTLGKQVALKVIRAELTANHQVIARFSREAMTTARFEHPHVASAIDYGTLPEGGAYLVMQLVQGRSLRSMLIAEQRLPWRRVCELGAQVADALCAAEAFGVIHRDLKPDNILVETRPDGSDWVKVLDFGIAHVVNPATPSSAAAPEHAQLTHEGMVIGTIGYMAPEQATAGTIDHRTDLYGLGVVLWQCLAGKPLWDGKDFTSVLRQQFGTDVPRLRSLGIDPTLPQALDDLLQRLTARAPEQRPAHASEVRTALRAIAAGGAAPEGPRGAAVLGHVRGAAQAGVRAGGRLAAQSRAWITRGAPRWRAWAKRLRAHAAGGLATALRSTRAALAALAQGGSRLPWRRALWPLIALGATCTLGVVLVLVLRPDPSRGAPVPATAPSRAKAPAVVREQAAAQNTQDHDSTPPGLLGRLLPDIGVPEPVNEAALAIEQGKTVRERRAAAQRIVSYQPANRVPAALRRVAELELARSCSVRKRVLGEMREDPDARYVPSLRRLDQAPRKGCGFLDMSDCYACTRNDVRQTLRTVLGPEQGSGP